MVKKGKNGQGSGRLPPEDDRLWHIVTKDVERLDKKPEDAPLKTTLNDVQLPSLRNKPKAQKPVVEKQIVKFSQPAQLDLRTDLRLKKGQMEIEARLDLHGHTQDSAHRMLNSFLLRCHAAGMRCVLVITGKGKRIKQGDILPNEARAVGVLKQMLPMWLDMPPIKSIVLKHYFAKPKDGGEGAYYIYLKRIRD